MLSPHVEMSARILLRAYGDDACRVATERHHELTTAGLVADAFTMGEIMDYLCAEPVSVVGLRLA